MILIWFQLPSFLPSITSGCTFHIWSISVVRNLYFKIFFGFFLRHISVSSDCMSINLHVPFSLSWIMSILLLGMVLAVFMC